MSSTTRRIGGIVRERRKNLGLTQRELAARAGVSERLVVSLELGDAPGIRVDKLLLVLEALGLSLSVTDDEGIEEPRKAVNQVHEATVEEGRYAHAFDQMIESLGRKTR